MRNCPEVYRRNCRNYLTKCKWCSAGKGKTTDALHYDPYINGAAEEDLSEHPHLFDSGKKSQVAKKRAASGLREEKKTLDVLIETLIEYGFPEKLVREHVTKTAASGRIFGDGDYRVFGDGAEHKYRMRSGSFTITEEEYLKGRKQGIKYWVIKNKHDTMVTMPLNQFAEYIATYLSVIKNEEQDSRES